MCVRVMYPFGFIRSANELARVARVAKVAKQKARRGPFCNIFCSFFFLFTSHQTAVTESKRHAKIPIISQIHSSFVCWCDPLQSLWWVRQPNAEYSEYSSITFAGIGFQSMSRHEVKKICGNRKKHSFVECGPTPHHMDHGWNWPIESRTKNQQNYQKFIQSLIFRLHLKSIVCSPRPLTQVECRHVHTNDVCVMSVW